MTDQTVFTRRRVLAALAGAGVVAAASPADAARIAIRLDLSQIARSGGDHPMLRAILQQEYGRAFAGAAVPTGQTLVVKVKSVYFSGGGGGRGRGYGGRGDAGGETDYLDVDVQLLGARGQILATYSILSPVPASAGYGALWSTDLDQQRLTALVRHNAGWARRYILG